MRIFALVLFLVTTGFGQELRLSTTARVVPLPEIVSISPLMTYSSYLGGSEADFAKGIAADEQGFIYLTGTTASDDFPVASALQDSSAGDFDIFVTKLDLKTNTVVFSTYIGGTGVDSGNNLVVDRDGAIYVTGNTSSSDFPIVNAFQSDYCGGAFDAFVFKLAPNGDKLEYSTYLGGKLEDFGADLRVDVEGSAYLTGRTASTDFPLERPIQDMLGGLSDAFIAKLNADGQSLSYIVGRTASPDFPITDAFQPVIGGAFDGFVARLDDAGEVIMASFIGGSGGSAIAETGDNAQGLALDSNDNIYVSGHSRSTDFPTVEPFQNNHGGGDNDGFLVRISPMTTSVPAGPPPVQVSAFELAQNYPNPFNPVTTIGFRLAQRSPVELTVFDVMGKRVAILVDEERAPGYHKVTFEAKNLVSGVYFYRLRVGTAVQERKMLLIR